MWHAGAAAAVLARDLGTALPPGVVVVGMIDGGFQDRFMQIKLGADAEVTAALLSALKADMKRPLAPRFHQTTIAEAPCWDIDPHADLVVCDASLGRFEYAVAGVVPDPADAAPHLIYMIAYET